MGHRAEGRKYRAWSRGVEQRAEGRERRA